jgi:hypothetical protein
MDYICEIMCICFLEFQFSLTNFPASTSHVPDLIPLLVCKSLYEVAKFELHSLYLHQNTHTGWGDLDMIKLILIQSDYLPRFTKYKVRNSSGNDHLSQKHASRRPHVNPIATATVHITIVVHLDAVRYAVIGERK